MATQGRLAYEVASRPLLAEYLHAEAVVSEIIARCGEFGATWGPTDPLDLAVDAQGAYLLIGLCVEDYHTGIVQAGCKFGPVRRIGHTQDSAVDLQTST